MKKHLFSLAATLMISGLGFGQVAETISNAEPVSASNNGTNTVADGVMAGTLYSNGPYYNIEGSPNLSELQTSLGLSTYGFAMSDANAYRVADDWVVNQPVSVDKIYIYGYQTGSGNSSTFTYGTLQIWDGEPGVGNVIWGDEFDDIMSETTWTGAYRVLDTDHANTDRPIMVIVLDTPGLTLTPGTYWLDYNTGGSGASGPWAPPIVITGDTETGNAIQWDGSAWNALIDTGANAQQGLPFDVDGAAMGVKDITSVEYSIYPNPTSKFLNINAKNPIQSVKVYNLAGQEVMSIAPKGINASLDVSVLAKGTYVLQTVINGKTQTTKFVKK